MRFATGCIQFVIRNPVDDVGHFFHASITPVACALADNVKVPVEAIAVAIEADVGEIQVRDRLRKTQRTCPVGTECNDVRRARSCHSSADVRGSG